ncbi:MAG: hypothetical protein HRT43_00955 [Campylobacteraceae bacterium]|nr:hypothetical protein [Campylobacteraceae bacterium]
MRFFILLLLFISALHANSMKEKFTNCEVVVLSELTDIVSCHKIDYLIEYTQNDEYKRGEVIKVSVITETSVKVIKQ